MILDLCFSNGRFSSVGKKNDGFSASNLFVKSNDVLRSNFSAVLVALLVPKSREGPRKTPFRKMARKRD